MAAARGLISRPSNWCGSTVTPSSFEQPTGPRRAIERVEHFAFEALQVLQRDVEEIAASRRRDRARAPAEAMVKIAQLGDGLVVLAFLGQRQRGGLRVGPVVAQRLDDGGQHQPFDIGARRVVRAELVAFGGSSARSSSVPKMAGSTWRQSARAASISRSIWSRSSGRASGSVNSSPLKRSTSCAARRRNRRCPSPATGGEHAAWNSVRMSRGLAPAGR